MRASFLRCAPVMVTSLILVSGTGCSGTPDEHSSFAMPSIGGVPEQWEPEFATAEPEDTESAF